MSMNTYSFEERSALDIDHKLAAAVILGDVHKTDPGSLRADIRETLDGGTPAWKAIVEPSFHGWLKDNGFFDVSDAFDILSDAGVDGLVHCSEFQGAGQPADGFENVPGNLAAGGSWEDDFVCFLTPENKIGLFRAAYESPQALIDEYRAKLEPFIGPGFDYTRSIMDVSGTYFA